MSFGPSNPRREQISEIPTFLRQFIGITHGAFLVWRARYDPSLFQPFQSIGQNICGNSLRRIEQFTVRRAAAKKVPCNQQRPFIANDVEQIGNRARRARETQRPISLRSRAPRFPGLPAPFFNLHIASYDGREFVTCKMQVTKQEGKDKCYVEYCLISSRSHEPVDGARYGIIYNDRVRRVVCPRFLAGRIRNVRYAT